MYYLFLFIFVLSGRDALLKEKESAVRQGGDMEAPELFFS